MNSARFVLACALLGVGAVVAAQSRPPDVPLATALDRALAQIEVSRDGRAVTVRAIAPDTLQLCVEPKSGAFGARRCFSVGAIRRGDVRLR